MDNLTHSMVGALLGRMGLRRLTGRATVTLVLAANLPDIDAIAMVASDQSLAIRRGLTHGPIALILPPILVGLVLAWNCWRPSAHPVRPAALLMLAYLGTLTHPMLDWLNSYGIRLLEPFSSRWFAGDTLFIIDIWLWGALIASLTWSIVRERRGGDWQRPAWVGFAAIGAYIAANGLISGHAEGQACTALVQRGETPSLVVANPLPLRFWERRMLWRNDERHGDGRFDLRQGLSLRPGSTPNRLDDPRLAALSGRPDVAAFLFWSRMPIVVEPEGRAMLTDQRFASRPQGGGQGTALRYNPFSIPLE